MWDDYTVVSTKLGNEEPIAAQLEDTKDKEAVKTQELTTQVAPNVEDSEVYDPLSTDEVRDIIARKDAAALMDAVCKDRVVILSVDASLRFKQAYKDVKFVFLPTLAAIANVTSPLSNKEKEVEMLIAEYQKMAPELKGMKDAGLMGMIGTVTAIAPQVMAMKPLLESVWQVIDFNQAKGVEWENYADVFQRYGLDMKGLMFIFELIKKHGEMEQLKSLKGPDTVVDNVPPKKGGWFSK